MFSAEISITSVRYSPSSPSTFNTCTGSVFAVVVPIPNSPFVLFPQVHTVPSSFNITVNPDAFTILAPNVSIFTCTVPFKLLVLSTISIVAIPSSTGVNTPFSSTFTTFSSDDVNVISPNVLFVIYAFTSYIYGSISNVSFFPITTTSLLALNCFSDIGTNLF